MCLLINFVIKVPQKQNKVPAKLKRLFISEPIKELEIIIDLWDSRWNEYICTQTHEPITGFFVDNFKSTI